MSLELTALIKSMGYFGIWTIIFAECGVLFGILLPGDTLLFTLGVLARRGLYDLDIMIVGCMVSAFLGNLFNYEIGKRYGLKFFKRYASRFITDEQVDMTNAFFNKHGVTTIILVRFVPLMRTIAPFLAGVVRMDYRMFVLHSFIGALIWAVGLPLVGYYFGQFIPDEWMEWLALPVIMIVLAIIIAPYVQKFRKKKHTPTHEQQKQLGE
jgi:membrane-associated protein